MLFILLLSLLSLSYSFIQPNAQSKSLFFSNNVKMMNSELIETANTLISRGTLGTPWSLNDLFINLDNSNVEMASILNNMNTVVALDKNFGDVITDDNLHAIKTLPHLTDTIIDAFVKNNINFDILNYEPHGLFSYIPGPFQFFMIYLLFLNGCFKFYFNDLVLLLLNNLTTSHSIIFCASVGVFFSLL